MNCRETRCRLDDYLDARLDAAMVRAVEAHLSVCSECSAHLKTEQLLRERLQQLPAPPPPKAFTRRVLAATQVSRRAAAPQRPRGLRLAAAAAVLAVVAGGAWLTLQGGAWAPQQVVTMQGGSVQRLKLVFNSPGALSGVTLHVGLPEGVELAQYPGVRELTWQADLKPGANLLALPVIVRGDGGTVLASVSFGAERKQFTVQVLAGTRDGASLDGWAKLATVPPGVRRT
jgi:hypothetical protein